MKVGSRLLQVLTQEHIKGFSLRILLSDTTVQQVSKIQNQTHSCKQNRVYASLDLCCNVFECTPSHFRIRNQTVFGSHVFFHLM